MFPLKLLRIILVSSTESVRPHSAAVEKVHSSPKLNLREGVVVDTENETGNEHIPGGVGAAGVDGNSPVKDPSKVQSGNSQSTNSTNSTNKDKESKAADDSFWFFKYLLVKKLMDNPEYLILVQGLLVSIFCYFLVGLSVSVFARGKANSVPNPFASLNPEVNSDGEKDWSYFSWFWTKCFRWFFGPPPDVLNLDDAFPGKGIVVKHRIQNTNLSRLAIHSKYYSVLQPTTKYCSVPQSTTRN